MYLKYYSTVLKETGGEKMLHWKSHSPAKHKAGKCDPTSL